MKIKEGDGMDLQKEREAFEAWVGSNGRSIERFSDGSYKSMTLDKEWEAWQAAKARMEVRINTLDEMLLNQGEALAQAKAQAVPEQLDVNSILHDIDCYFDNGLSNTERTANNLLQSIYEKLSGEVKAQESAND